MKDQRMSWMSPFVSQHLKRVAVLVFVSCMVSSLAQAAPVRWGVRGGLSAATLGGDFGEVIDGSTKSGLDAGFTLQWPLTTGFALETGASYVNKGSKARSEGTDPFGNPTGTFDSKWNFDYVEVPLLLRVEVLRETRIKPYIEAGPSLGILLDGTFEPGVGPFPDQSLKDDLKPVDLGYAVGAGVTLPLQRGRLGVGLRYTSAFSDAFDLDNNLEALNRTWSIALSWSQ